MEWQQPYFIWNNKSAFERGQGDKIQISSQGITLAEAGEPGVYYTRICDSRREGMQWDRLLLQGDIRHPQQLHITVYSCETDVIVVGNKRYDLYEIMRDSSFTIEEKDRLFQSYKCLELDYMEYQLLHRVTGRFLWMRFQFYPMGGEIPQIYRIQVYFPKMSWTEYLPELYRKGGDSFLERYLEIFQTMYQEMNDSIQTLPELYAAGHLSSEWLVWLSQWLSIEDPYLWKEEQLRYLIQHGIELAMLRGTSEYMKRMIWLYTGRKPYIVEYWQWAYMERDSRNRKRMERLYGSDSFCVTVILEGQAVTDRRRMGGLKRLISHCSPAHIETRLEVLQPYIFLDQHSYLGINSCLGEWGDAVLDGQSFLPFVVLKNKEKQYEGS